MDAVIVPKSRPTVFILAGALLALASFGAGAVNRCEDRNGRVTYTDEPCPANARSARRVDDSPPVQVRDAAATGEPAAARGEKPSPPTSDKGDGDKGGASPALQPSRLAASSSPEQEIQRLDELRARQQRQCAEVNRRIDYTRRDLQAAIGADRASVELTLRRLQEEARLVCPPK